MHRGARRFPQGARRAARWALACVAGLALLIGGAMNAVAAGHPAPMHGRMAASAEEMKLEWVTSRLMCMCGCSLTVYACERSMPCEVAPRMKEQARQKLASGMTPAAALTSFARDYGDRVLAEPTKKGFNLTAWVLPFAGLGFGTLFVILALQHWRPQRQAAAPLPPEADPEYAAKVEDEIRRGL